MMVAPMLMPNILGWPAGELEATGWNYLFSAQRQSAKAGTVTMTVRGQGPVTRKGLTDEQASGLSEIGFAAVEGEPQIVSVPAGVAGAQDCVSVGFAFLTPEARDNIGNAAIALQEYSAKAEQEALKVEAEQTTALAIERSMAFR